MRPLPPPTSAADRAATTAWLADPGTDAAAVLARTSALVRARTGCSAFDAQTSSAHRTANERLAMIAAWFDHFLHEERTDPFNHGVRQPR